MYSQIPTLKNANVNWGKINCGCLCGDKKYNRVNNQTCWQSRIKYFVVEGACFTFEKNYFGILCSAENVHPILFANLHAEFAVVLSSINLLKITIEI